MPIELGKTAVPVLLAAPKTGDVLVAAYKSADGQTLISSIDYTPYNPVTGDQMQRASSKKERITTAQLNRNFVPVGHCPSCRANLVASASLADLIESANEDFHCPVCTASVSPSVEISRLTSALAAEFADDEDEDAGGDEDYGDEDMGDEGMGDEDMGDEGMGDEDMGDEDMGDEGMGDDGTVAEGEGLDDGGDEADDVDFGGGAGGEDESYNDDDTTPTDDMPEDEDENHLAAASVRKQRRTRRMRRTLRAIAGDEDPDHDGDNDMIPEKDFDHDQGEETGEEHTSEDEDNDEIEAAALQLRREIRRRKQRRLQARASEEPLPVGEHEGIPGEGEDSTTAENTENEFDDNFEHFHEGDENVVAALAAYVKKEYANAGLPIAGKPLDNERARKVTEAAQDRLRQTARQPDGHRKVRSAALKATSAMGIVDPLGMEDNLNNDAMADRVDDITPGTNPTDAQEPTGLHGDTLTPGTDFTGTAGEPEGQIQNQGEPPCPNTPPPKEDGGNKECLSGDALVDWATAKVELIASQHGDDVWVVAGSHPVARLVKEKASAGVVSHWGTPVLASAFNTVCRKGLPPEEAKEFGFVPVTYTVAGSDVIRTAMRRSADLSTANAQKMSASNTERYKQSLKTAMLASLKGTFADLKNPLRDRLITELAKIGAHEPQLIVDKAFASCVDEFVSGVFAKTDELAAKPDAARNETARFVAEATYQSRMVDPGVELAGKLAAGKTTAFTPKGDYTPPARDETAGNHKVLTQTDLTRMALRSLGRI